MKKMRVKVDKRIPKFIYKFKGFIIDKNKVGVLIYQILRLIIKL